MSLKAFGPHEPQVPAATTTIVQVAGLDAIGARSTDEHVHRAETLAAALGDAARLRGDAGVFADGLREQLRRLRRAQRPARRIVTLLNKADGPDEQASGWRVARELLVGARGRTCSAGVAPTASRRRGRGEPAGAAFAAVSSTEVRA